MRRIRGLIGYGGLVGTGVLAMLLGSAPANAAKTFTIDEGMTFINNCGSDVLNDVTSGLEIELEAAGWTGQRYPEDQAWPQHFMERCSSSYGSSGYDSSYGDRRSLSVFAGHGNDGSLFWSHPQWGRCGITLGANARLGSMDGRTAAVGMWLSSNTLKRSSLVANANNQWLWQQLGFDNSPWIYDLDTAFFFYDTGTSSGVGGSKNADAWLDVMDHDWNVPIVVSYGANSNECWYVHDHAKLRNNVLTFARGGGPTCKQGQPAFWYCYEIAL